MKDTTQIIFIVDGVLLYLILAGIVWSIAFPQKRIWPPPGKKSWQHKLTWACYYMVCSLNTFLFVLDWNSGLLKDVSRFLLGIPITLIGVLLVLWGVFTLGLRNTSGLRDGLVIDGPYRFTRNPQYLGDILIFIGLSLIANSGKLWIVHGLLIFAFLITPLAEEVWLEEQFGEPYQEYKWRTTRFL